MSEKQRKISIPASLTGGQYQVQEQPLMVQEKPGKLYIGIPKEVTMQENRVSLVPSSIASLVARGHRVLVETNAGIKSNFTDHEYSEAGAEIAHTPEQVYEAHVIIKVAPPTLEEIDLMHPDQILISPLQLPTVTDEYLLRLREKRVISLAMEYIQDDSGNFPVVRIMSELAGISAMQTAAELLANTNNGKGILLGGISGVPSTKVVILGAGIVAEFATRAAIGLGAEVRIFDDNIYKLMRIQHQVGRPLYTSAINPQYLEQELITADVVIGAIHAKSGRTPMVVTEPMIAKMSPGSVIVDVSIDQGGCFETSRVTSHTHPTFRRHGIIHYCVPNIASRVSRTASIAVSNIFTPLLLQAGENGGWEKLLHIHSGVRHAVYTYKGRLTNEYLSRRFGMKYTDLDLLVTSQL